MRLSPHDHSETETCTVHTFSLSLKYTHLCSASFLPVTPCLHHTHRNIHPSLSLSHTPTQTHTHTLPLPFSVLYLCLVSSDCYRLEALLQVSMILKGTLR